MKTKATVMVVAREGFNGFWSAQRHFQNGLNLVELEAAEIAGIEADSKLGLPISVIEGWPKAALEVMEKAKAEAEAAELARLEAEEAAAKAAAAKGKR